MRTYDLEFEYTTEKGTVLLVQYTGEHDDIYSKIEKGRYCVSVDYIRQDCNELRDFIQGHCENLYDDIHDAAVNDFINQIERRLTA